MPLCKRLNSLMKKIFVSVSCYDDADVTQTCLDMVAKAVRPDDLRIVVVLQTDEPERFKALNSVKQVEVALFPKSWATGVGKARAYAFSQLKDEPYFFQTDCHMRFQPGWDATLLSELAACPDPAKAVLSNLPPEFVIETGELLTMTPFAPKPEKFVEAVPVSKFEPIPPNLPAPPLIAHIAASVVFCCNEAARASPPDPFYAYYGEEFSHSLRWWTKGYSMYAIRPCVAHHAYQHNNKRPSLYEEPEHIMRHWRSMQRVTALLKLAPRETLSQAALTDLDQYDLGDVRAVASWEVEFGVDLAQRKVL